MDTEGKYNIRSPAVKRLMREARELRDATDEYSANPLEDNLFEWHFTIRGPPETEFDGGVYHGRIILPTEYPMKPPNIILLTPNGRFETNKKICLSISGHHPETWQPSWSIRTAILALIAFMPTPVNGALGALDYTPEERKALARKSRSWKCPECGKIVSKLSTSPAKPPTEEEANFINNISLKDKEFQDEKEKEQAVLEELNKNTEHEQVAERQEELISVLEVGPRQRIVHYSATDDTEVSHNVQETEQVINSRMEVFRNFLIWFLLVAIIILICRRLFLV